MKFSKRTLAKQQAILQPLYLKPSPQASQCLHASSNSTFPLRIWCSSPVYYATSIARLSCCLNFTFSASMPSTRQRFLQVWVSITPCACFLPSLSVSLESVTLPKANSRVDKTAKFCQTSCPPSSLSKDAQKKL